MPHILKGSGYRRSGCVNRIEERYDLGAIGRKRERIDAACSRASMRYIIQYFIERIRRSVVEESLREGKQRRLPSSANYDLTAKTAEGVDLPSEGSVA